MYDEYLAFKDSAQNLSFKIPCTLTGLQLAVKISGNSTVAVTSIFHPSQTYLAAQAGERYIIPYVNRSTRFTGDGIALIGNLRIILSGTQCEILAASIKSSPEAAKVIGEFDQKLSQMEALIDNRK
jgi:transaldolase